MQRSLILKSAQSHRRGYGHSVGTECAFHSRAHRFTSAKRTFHFHWFLWVKMKARRGRDYGATMARLCWELIMGPLYSLSGALCCSLLRVCLPFSFFFSLHITSVNLFSTSFFIFFLSVCISFQEESPRATKLQSISRSVRLLPLFFHLSPGLHLWGGQKNIQDSIVILTICILYII